MSEETDMIDWLEERCNIAVEDIEAIIKGLRSLRIKVAQDEASGKEERVTPD